MDFLNLAAGEIAEAQLGTAGVTFVVGILNCFLGYRLLKVWVSLAGFTMGALLGYSLASHFTRDSLAQLAAVVAAGLILGLAAFHVYRIGVFLLCANVGTVAASILLQPRDSLKFMVCLGIGVAIGLLGMAFAKPMVILNTALGGGFSAASAVAGLLGKPADMKILLLGAALAAAGVIVQAAAPQESSSSNNKYTAQR